MSTTYAASYTTLSYTRVHGESRLPRVLFQFCAALFIFPFRLPSTSRPRGALHLHRTFVLCVLPRSMFRSRSPNPFPARNALPPDPPIFGALDTPPLPPKHPSVRHRTILIIPCLLTVQLDVDMRSNIICSHLVHVARGTTLCF